MSESWQGNFQIEVGSKSPQTSHAPALAVFNGQLQMVYIGSGGNNIWHSSTVGEQLTNWTGNEQIAISGAGNAPLTTPAGNPETDTSVKAAAIFAGVLCTVYKGRNSNDIRLSSLAGV